MPLFNAAGKRWLQSVTNAQTATAVQTAVGTVTASELVSADANKDCGDFRNLDAINVDAGASGTAGSVDVFPSTASKGKLAITAADSSGDTTTTIVNASQATTRTYTIPDALASCQFLLGAQAAVARTATADGLTTGTIADAGRLQHITVTSADANHIIVLPTPTPGTIVVLDVGATGFELRSNAPSTVLINGGTGGAAVESAIPANSTAVMFCVTATAWKGFYMDADSDLAKVEAAA